MPVTWYGWILWTLWILTVLIAALGFVPGMYADLADERALISGRYASRMHVYVSWAGLGAVDLLVLGAWARWAPDLTTGRSFHWWSVLIASSLVFGLTNASVAAITRGNIRLANGLLGTSLLIGICAVV
jgi:hypothetical protein